MRLIPKSTDQLYAIPIDCIAVDLIIQVSAMLQLKREQKSSFPSDVTWRTEMNFAFMWRLSPKRTDRLFAIESIELQAI